MTLIRFNNEADKRAENTAVTWPQELLSPSATTSTNTPTTDAVAMDTLSQMPRILNHDPDPTDWRYAGDACAAKRAAGGCGYQDDVHLSASAAAKDYACGRGLGKW